MLQEILDDAIVIECEYPSINQGDTGKRWFRIKTALVEAQKTPTNTESLQCNHCNGEPGIPTMLRWDWNYCPECGVKLMEVGTTNIS